MLCRHSNYILRYGHVMQNCRYSVTISYTLLSCYADTLTMPYIIAVVLGGVLIVIIIVVVVFIYRRVSAKG